MKIDVTLAAREERYGSFKGHAEISQGIKDVMHGAPKWENISDDKKEALDMIAHKIARIINGDPEYIDSWYDIRGYARLIEVELE